MYNKHAIITQIVAILKHARVSVIMRKELI